MCRSVRLNSHRQLAQRAQAVLNRLGYQDVAVHVGDGTLGWPEAAPFDAIVIGAAALVFLVPCLRNSVSAVVSSLPMGEEDLQTLVRIWKERSGLREEYFGECRFVKLRGEHGWET